jgi:hypothetical protein
MHRKTVMVLLLLASIFWQTRLQAGLVLSSSGTMRFEWVNLKDSGGNSLASLPVGVTATADAASFGWADAIADQGSASGSFNYYRNGVLVSPGFWPQSPFGIGDEFETDLQADGTIDSVGVIDIFNTTWSTLYINNTTPDTFTAEFAVDYSFANSFQGTLNTTIWSDVVNYLGITVNYDYGNSTDDFEDYLLSPGVDSGSRSLSLVVPVAAGWTVVDVIRRNSIYVEAVPEPSTGVLYLVGLSLWTARRRRVARS